MAPWSSPFTSAPRPTTSWSSRRVCGSSRSRATTEPRPASSGCRAGARSRSDGCRSTGACFAHDALAQSLVSVAGSTSRVATSELRPDVRPLIFPRSAALIGATPRNAEEVIAAAARKGVDVVAVHRRHKDVAGIEWYPSIGEVPFVPELALMLVGHRAIEAAVGQALAAGVRAFIIPGLG